MTGGLWASAAESITWHIVYVLLAVVFSIHLLAFAFLALRRNTPRYHLLVGTFGFLTLIYGARSLQLGTGEFFLTCRILAVACTLAYVAGLLRRRRLQLE